MVYLNKKGTRYSYVPINKNASSWGLRIFTNLGFQRHDIADNHAKSLDKRFIVFLRDPVKRWKSGVAQWFFMTWEKKYSYRTKLNDPIELDTYMLELLTTAVQIEAHTWPQTNWTKLLDPKKIIYFNIDHDNFSHDFDHFLHTYVHIPKNTLLKAKQKVEDEKVITAKNNYALFGTEKNPLKSYIMQQLNKRLDYEQLERVRKFYQEDIELINNCEYYQPREAL